MLFHFLLPLSLLSSASAAGSSTHLPALLWAAAGNSLLTETVARAPGVVAASTGLLLVSAVHLARRGDGHELDWVARPSGLAVAVAVVTGLLLALFAWDPVTVRLGRQTPVMTGTGSSVWHRSLGQTMRGRAGAKLRAETQNSPGKHRPA